MSNSKYYESQICTNKYVHKVVLYNHDTQKYFQPKCKSYSCPKHGFIQKQKLQKAIRKWLEVQSNIRFWTFTIRKTNNYSVGEFNLLFKKVWHTFITELRRNKILTKKEQRLQYVKVYEAHKTGCLHIHLFATEYIHWTKLQSLWDYSIQCHFVIQGKVGNVHTKKILSARRASLYISKYVTKMSKRFDVKVRAWSKSGKVAIFDKRVSSGNWSLIRKDGHLYRRLQAGLSIVLLFTPCVTPRPPVNMHNCSSPLFFGDRVHVFDYDSPFPRYRTQKEQHRMTKH